MGTKHLGQYRPRKRNSGDQSIKKEPYSEKPGTTLAVEMSLVFSLLLQKASVWRTVQTG